MYVKHNICKGKHMKPKNIFVEMTILALFVFYKIYLVENNINIVKKCIDIIRKCNDARVKSLKPRSACTGVVDRLRDPPEMRIKVG